MAVYDSRQVNRMRQDAIRRSQEMYRRSSVNSTHYSQGQAEEQKNNSLPVKEKSNESANYPAVRENSSEKKDITSLIKSIIGEKLDSDKLLIAALMIILIKEGADMKLILALGYILL